MRKGVLVAIGVGATLTLVAVSATDASACSRRARVCGGYAPEPAYQYAPPPPVYYAPPAPVVAYRPPWPGVGYAWVPGYWYPVGRRHVWRAGYWAYRPYPRVYRTAPAYYGPRYSRSYWRR